MKVRFSRARNCTDSPYDGCPLKSQAGDASGDSAACSGSDYSSVGSAAFVVGLDQFAALLASLAK